jgi:peptide/nickel transport system substrate-binding protein
MKHTQRWRLRLVAATLTLGVVAAACGDDGGDNTSDATGATGATTTKASGATGSTTTGAPVKGGIVTIATFSNSPGLDPTKLAGGGTVGGMENAAIYDTIVSYDGSTGKYTPRTGSFTSNADFTKWTLKLKSGIKFADGTDYNADAVKFVVAREMKEGNSSPRSQLLTFLDADPEKSMKVVDPLTIEFTLKLAWSDFQYLFSSVAGWIYSPTQFQKVGDPVKFNADPGPAGAGPFKVKSYKPGEALELERNPNYWGGEVYLDGLVFKQLASPQAAFDAVKTGSIQAAYVRDPLVVSNTKKESTLATVDMPTVAGSMININAGAPIDCKGGKPEPVCTGKPDGQTPSTSPTKDINLRKAVQLAVDPAIVNQRVWQGAATETNAPFAGGPFDPKVSGPKPNVAEAKKLVDAAKAAGWNGKIRLLADASVPAWGEAVRLQLVAAGFDVDLQTKPISEIVTAVLTNKDFDLSTWAYGMTDEFPTNYVQLAGTFAAPAGRYGYSSPDMVAAVDKIRTAQSDADRVAAYKGVSDIWLRDMPAAVLAALPQSLISTNKLKGVTRTAGSNLLFDKAYLAK